MVGNLGSKKTRPKGFLYDLLKPIESVGHRRRMHELKTNSAINDYPRKHPSPSQLIKIIWFFHKSKICTKEKHITKH